MFGKNQKLTQERTDGSILKIKEIFGTLQGEGPYTGWPAVFVRLAGCNLACTFCDTDFDDYREISVPEILNNIVKSWQKWSQIDCFSTQKCTPVQLNLPKMIVITGGEPLRQNIGPLCEALLAKNLTVQIESNGLLYFALPKQVNVVCSPKISGGKYWPVHRHIVNHIIGFKLLVAHQGLYSDEEVIAEALQLYSSQKPNCPIYVQPIDEYDASVNRKNIEYAMYIANRYHAILSLQIHKYLDIK